MRIVNKFIKVVCGILIFILLLTLGFYIAQKVRVFAKDSTDIINTRTQSFEEIIELSDEITIEKKLFSLRKHYYILSDGVLIGEVKGKLFPIFGDTLQLKDVHGNLIKKESQIKRLGLTQVKLFNISINRLAKVEDANGDTTGYIGEEKQRDFWRLKRVQYFYDKNCNKEGRAIPDASYSVRIIRYMIMKIM